MKKLCKKGMETNVIIILIIALSFFILLAIVISKILQRGGLT